MVNDKPKFRYKWQREEAMQRIREIPDAKLLDDLANPEKEHKHWRIVQEFGRRYIKLGCRLPLKNGDVITVYDFRGDGYFYTGRNTIPLFVDVVDWKRVVKRPPASTATIVAVIPKHKEPVKPKPKRKPNHPQKEFVRRFSKWTVKQMVELHRSKS